MGFWTTLAYPLPISRTLLFTARGLLSDVLQSSHEGSALTGCISCNCAEKGLPVMLQYFYASMLSLKAIEARLLAFALSVRRGGVDLTAATKSSVFLKNFQKAQILRVYGDKAVSRKVVLYLPRSLVSLAIGEGMPIGLTNAVSASFQRLSANVRGEASCSGSAAIPDTPITLNWASVLTDIV